MADIRDEVRKEYGRIAATQGKQSCCSPACCSPDVQISSGKAAKRDLGYAAEDLRNLPADADLNLGCGNPHALASLQPGQTVLDLGSGGGIDCFIASRRVGPEGKVIGVDMTAEMVALARENAKKVEASNVEFRLGEIEHLPVGNGSVDVIMSNCVINLSPDKSAVYREAHRVLRNGGRLAIADMVATTPIPEEIRQNVALYTGCVAGAITVDEMKHALADAGFVNVEIQPADASGALDARWNTEGRSEARVFSALITATKRA